ncbi:MAG TPA: PLDc N-terminal domain-containing protein [Actinomycetota bacterium]|nr:PLDc N-terminal domain-containing protein [Actinomycetota bacterium]
MVIFLIALWVRTIIDIIKNQDYRFRAGNQIVWLIVVILVPFVGVPLYWILGAPERPMG